MTRKFSPKRLRAARIAAGLRPEQLALTIGRSVYSIHEYERGRVQPPVDIAAALADALGCGVEQLIEPCEVSHVA